MRAPEIDTSTRWAGCDRGPRPTRCFAMAGVHVTATGEISTRSPRRRSARILSSLGELAGRTGGPAQGRWRTVAPGPRGGYSAIDVTPARRYTRVRVQRMRALLVGGKADHALVGRHIEGATAAHRDTVGDELRVELTPVAATAQRERLGFGREEDPVEADARAAVDLEFVARLLRPQRELTRTALRWAPTSSACADATLR